MSHFPGDGGHQLIHILVADASDLALQEPPKYVAVTSAVKGLVQVEHLLPGEIPGAACEGLKSVHGGLLLPFPSILYGLYCIQGFALVLIRSWT